MQRCHFLEARGEMTTNSWQCKVKLEVKLIKAHIFIILLTHTGWISYAITAHLRILDASVFK